jgi:hypothetical protein
MRHVQIAEACARAAHDVNNRYNDAIGDPLAPPWEDMTDAQRAGVVAGAAHAIAGGTAEGSHALWMKSREAEGWTYGPVKSFEAKVSPCLLPYADLPEAQRRKDALFQSVVRGMYEALR